jgi:photosystem II stability/assembly factor-like uncharacterized protein
MMSSPSPWRELEPSCIEPPVKAKPAAAATSAPATPPKPIGPIWQVSVGVLQKSNDGGDTWGAVAVPSRVRLNVVLVLGQDIWIGGDQGALYHSSDSGQTWTPVVPTSDGVRLYDDIVRIDFLDLRHGGIATRKGDIWATRDGGATWSLVYFSAGR